VLGRKSVSPGMRQMFAVISTPISDAVRIQEVKKLTVSVKTYWRKYHRDTLTTSDDRRIGKQPNAQNAVPDNRKARRLEAGAEETVLVPTTSQYQDKLKPRVCEVNWTRVDEKTALISVRGENFFSGTTVAMGGTAAVTGVVIKSNQAMDIVTPIENIGAGNPMVIGRYGTAQPLRVSGTGKCAPSAPVGARLAPPIAGYRELRVPVDCPASDLMSEQLVILANGRPVGTPGVSPDPKDKDHKSIVASQVPVALFPKGEGTIAVVSPFRSPFRLEFPWYDDAYALRRATVGKKTLIIVQRTDDVVLTDPAFGTSPESRWRGRYADVEIKPTFLGDTLMQFALPEASAEGPFILYEPTVEGGVKAYLLELPAAKEKPKQAIEAAGGQGLAITQNDAPKLDFTGERVGDVASVRVEGREPFKTEYDAQKKVLSVYVPQEATKLPARFLTVQFRDAAGKSIATQTLEIKALAK
jgi:hypothetical protein